jgi:hypothetical protein
MFVARAISMRGRVHIAALLPALALACVSSEDIAGRAVDYNMAAAAARDEMLLLNVLRSRDRRPMVFTGLSRITGSVRYEASMGAAIPIGADAPNEALLTPRVGISDSPSFDIAILDSQEFTRGIMTPVSMKLLEYYWDQGYNREVLLYLCVERIELDDSAGGPPTLLVNEPGEPSFADFQALLWRIVDSGRFEANPHQTEDIGPAVDTGEAASLSTLVRVGESDLALQRDEDARWQLRRPTDVPRLAVPATEQDPGLFLYAAKYARERAAHRSPEEPRARLVLRSPQAVLYFLGELTRPGKELSIRPRRAGQPPQELRLFVIREARECAPGVVRVDYDGRAYVVPDGEGECHPGRSMQSLAFAAQLLSLQQSSKDLPATGSVRIIGN